MSLELIILGCSSSLPLSGRSLPAQLLHVNDRKILIDCGEGTQIRLRQEKQKFQQIQYMLISHLHGDHYLGLPGLLQSMSLLGRQRELTLIVPPGLQEILEVQFRHSGAKLNFTLTYHTLRNEEPQWVWEDEGVRIMALPLAHRIPTWGFLIREKEGMRRIIPEKLAEYKIPIEWRALLKQGVDFDSPELGTISNEELTLPPYPPGSYAYISDSAYKPELIPYLKGVQVLYHESTFTQAHKSRAVETAHSTAAEAAEMARECGVDRLIIGHYSARYSQTDPFLTEARAIFKPCLAARDGMRLRWSAQDPGNYLED